MTTHSKHSLTDRIHYALTKELTSARELMAKFNVLSDLKNEGHVASQRAKWARQAKENAGIELVFVDIVPPKRLIELVDERDV